MRYLIPLLAFVLCCTTALSWEATERDRVDSLSVRLQGEERLDVYIECRGGIGSLGLDFDEQVVVDSLRIVLMYGPGTPYEFCEGMGVDFSGSTEADVWAESHCMVRLSEEGSVTLPVVGGFTTLSLGWIDYYRE